MDFVEKIIDVFGGNGINISRDQAKMFETYKDELIAWNSVTNLTAIVDEDDIIVKHFLDSVLPYDMLENGSKVIDIGTGAGFPSVPLLIMNNNLDFTMVDSVDKKLNFVRHIVDKLGFKNVNIIHARCEDLAKSSEYREKYDYMVARAVSHMSTLMEYGIPFLKVGGRMLCYKGTNYNEEIDGSKNTFSVLHSKVVDVKEYPVKEIDTTRYVVVVEKNKATDSKYPRGMNKPRLKPLN